MKNGFAVTGKRFAFLLQKHQKFKNSVRLISASSQPAPQDDEKLWVKSPLGDVSTVVGFTMPELLREEMGDFGSLTAFVSILFLFITNHLYTLLNS